MKRNLLLSPHPKIHPHPHVPEIFSFSKENLEARKRMKRPIENSPQEIQSRSKKEIENGPLKDKYMARSGGGHRLRQI